MSPPVQEESALKPAVLVAFDFGKDFQIVRLAFAAGQRQNLQWRGVLGTEIELLQVLLEVLAFRIHDPIPEQRKQF